MIKRGRPKGHSPYISVPYDELGDWLGRKSKVLVCRKWYNKISEDSDGEVEEKPKQKVSLLDEEPKIEYTLTHL